MIVKELADKARVSTHVVRFYSRVGLLDPKRNHENGYKLFDNTDIDRVQFIRIAQLLGLKLKEIRALMDANDRGDTECCQRTAMIVYQHLVDTRKKIETLNALAARLEAALSEWRDVDGCDPLRSGVICPRISACGSDRPSGNATNLFASPAQSVDTYIDC